MKTGFDLEKQKNLFNKFTYDTLESLSTLYEAIDEKEPIGLRIVSQKKYEEAAKNGEFEGMNEYPDYDAFLDAFSLQEINEKLETLTDEEMNYIAAVVQKALITINPSQSERKLIPELVDYINKKDKETLKRISPIVNGMTRIELKALFEKYHVIELEEFDKILKYCTFKNIDAIKREKDKIYNAKYSKLTTDYECCVRPLGFNVESLSKKNELLTDYQLETVLMIVEDASTNLDILLSCPEDIESDPNKAQINEINNFLNSLKNEKMKREIENAYEKHDKTIKKQN